VFTYTERNDNLGLCVIQDILEFAFRDNAFASEHIKEPRDIWRYTLVPTHRLSTPIHFKESVQEIPIFCRALKGGSGTHPTSALPYNKAQEDEVATSKSEVPKNPGSLYKYRKGVTANLQFQKSQNKVRSERKKLHSTAKDEQRERFFQNVRNQIVDRNYQGRPITFEPDISHVVPERKALADLEFRNRDVDSISDAELLDDRICSLEIRLALHDLEVPGPLQKRICFYEPLPDVADDSRASWKLHHWRTKVDWSTQFVLTGQMYIRGQSDIGTLERTRCSDTLIPTI
ncbi:uncharacterized protein KD926_004313, partial [Aspergillus affinis]|uniref:uncharacterized protein n=1 Tax=Aspergillus affinis TaxID=1070780 RepID=UPI0022FF0D2B